ncbi:MAG TPA: hypothetical protein VIS48_02995 [Candidatus Kryptonia bacterium]
MKPRDFSFVGLRLIAIFFVLESFRQMIQFVSVAASYRTENMGPVAALWGLGVSFILYLLIGVLMFVFAGTVADRVLRGGEVQDEEGEETEEGRATSDELESMIFSGIGLLIFGLSLERTCISVGQLLDRISIASGPYGSRYSAASWFSIIGSFLVTLFGLYLFVGVERVKRMWHNMRSFPEANDNPKE